MRKVPRNRAKIGRSQPSPQPAAAPPVVTAGPELAAGGTRTDLAVAAEPAPAGAELSDEDDFPGTLTIAELVGPDDADLLILRELADSPGWTTDPLGVARRALLDDPPAPAPVLPAQAGGDTGRKLAPTPVPLESLQSLQVGTSLL
jgi:hypothetical protein